MARFFASFIVSDKLFPSFLTFAFWGLTRDGQETTSVLMSTIAEATPTRSGCLGVLPLRRSKVS